MTQTKDIKAGDWVVLSENAKEAIENGEFYDISVGFIFPAKIKEIEKDMLGTPYYAVFEEEYRLNLKVDGLHLDWIDKYEPEEKKEPDWRGLPLLW